MGSFLTSHLLLVFQKKIFNPLMGKSVVFYFQKNVLIDNFEEKLKKMNNVFKNNLTKKFFDETFNFIRITQLPNGSIPWFKGGY